MDELLRQVTRLGNLLVQGTADRHMTINDPISAERGRRVLVIRNFELTLLDLFSAGKLNGTTHTCPGHTCRDQEYIPVALAPLTASDFAFRNHRGHGRHLARLRDPEGLLAEIMGGAGAVYGGVDDSRHPYRDHFHEIDSIDVREIREELTPLVADIQARHVWWSNSTRPGPTHSKGDDSRTAAEMEAARGRDRYSDY